VHTGARMRLFFQLISAIGGLVIAGCTVRYFVTVFMWPEYTSAQQDGQQDRRRTLIGKWLFYGYLIAAFIGTAYCIYKGATAALHWIPRNWVNIDEDGNREWMGYSLAFLAAFSGALGLFGGLSKLSDRIVNDGVEIRRLREALEIARKGREQSRT
jgi:hypothetical protein